MEEATKEEKKSLPERKKTFKVLGQEYTVDFPNTGALIEIEILKAQLSRNNYSGILDAGTEAGKYSKLLIDMISVFNVIFPELRTNMNVKTISQLDVLDSKKLLVTYLNDVLPWFNSWFEILLAIDED